MSGGVDLTDPTLRTLRRRLWNSLNCSNVWLGSLRFLKDGDLEALGSFGYRTARSRNAPMVPREAPPSRDAPSGFSILISRLPQSPQTI